MYTAQGSTKPGSSSKNPPRSEPSGSPRDEGAGAIRPEPTGIQTAPRKKRNHRGGKKKRARKQSFAVSTEDGSGLPETSHRRQSQHATRESLYRLQGRNVSNTSIDSEALLDHR